MSREINQPTGGAATGQKKRPIAKTSAETIAEMDKMQITAQWIEEEILSARLGPKLSERTSELSERTSPPPPVILPPPSPPRMPPTTGSISAGTPLPKSTAPPPLAPPSTPSPPRPSPPPPLKHPSPPLKHPSSPGPTSLPPPHGATLRTHANSAATGRKATALQGEMGRFACLLSMVFFAMAGLVVRQPLNSSSEIRTLRLASHYGSPALVFALVRAQA